MQFASIAVDQGHAVELFLIDDAIHWAQLGIAEGIRSTTGKHMKDLLEVLVKHWAPIHVCKACADKCVIGPDDIITGAVISSGPKLVGIMTSPDYKVFTL